MDQACQYVFSEINHIIIGEYNSSSRLSNRFYVIFQKILIRKNARFWKLYLRDVGLKVIPPPRSLRQMRIKYGR